MSKEERLEKKKKKIERYVSEGRGDWWFYPWWQKVAYVILFPFIMVWMGFCWLVMKLGHGIYVFGDRLSGRRWDGDWLQEV